jgi:ferric-dicitrate binding protein FerR (iron transport regulator)
LWIEGTLSAKHQRLDEVLWEMNARNKERLLIDDPASAQMGIGGTYNLMHFDEFLKTAHLMALKPFA